MKITPFKNHLYAVACAALLTFTVGCEKEVPAPAANGQDALPEARFKKQLSIGAQNRSDASFVVEVGASEQRLLDEIDGSSFTMNSNPVISNDNEVDAPHEHGDADESLNVSIEGRPHVTIDVLGTYSDAPVPDFGVQFSENFQKALEKSNAILTVDFGSRGGTPKVQAKANSQFYATQKHSTIRVRGNNAGVPEVVRFYRSNGYHDATFNISFRCDKCSHNAAYVQNFRLYQGGINGFDTYSYCW